MVNFTQLEVIIVSLRNTYHNRILVKHQCLLFSSTAFDPVLIGNNLVMFRLDIETPAGGVLAYVH